MPTTTITLFQLNDIHGYLNLHQELFPGADDFEYRPCGGYARLATTLRMWRALYPNSLLFDGGDTFHGTWPVVGTKGEILLPILRELDIAGMTAHWDFAYGPAHLQQLLAQLNYPLLAANVYNEQSGELAFPPYRVYQVGGRRVGVIGLACPAVGTNMPAHFSQGLRFTTGDAELPGCVSRLREQEQADLVVLLSHCGFPQDVDLLTRHQGIDVCLSSHTHNRLYEPVRVGRCLVMQSGSHGSFAGRLTLTLEEGRITAYDHELREIGADIAPDPVVQALIDQALLPYAYLREMVGIVRGALHRGTSVNAPMDDFLLESLRACVPADVYLSNGWRYGAPVLPGPVRLEDLYHIVPMDPEIETVELTGIELHQLLEDNLESTYSPDALRQRGGYVKRGLGLKVYFKMENPAGSRVQRALVGGQLLDPARTYLVAFVTGQAVPSHLGHARRSTGQHAVAAMRAYLDQHRPLAVGCPDSFVVV